MSALAALLPALVAVAAIALLLATPLAKRVLDHPGERSLHAAATPRFGGLGILAGAMPVLFFVGTPELLAIAGAALALAVLSFVDDLRGLPVAVRLPCHLAAAALAVAVAWPGGAMPGWGTLAAAAGAFLAIAWMTNLFNFMDGADGLAGGMAFVGFAALAFGAWHAGEAGIAFAAIAIASACAGFLAFNVPPARVFLGDVGSVPLGFLAGALGWLGAARGLWPAWYPVLVFSPFIVDATVTLLRRAARGEPVLRAHRTHYYQRLVLGGWSHRRLAAAAWALMAAVAASAAAALGQRAPVQIAIISVWALAYAALLLLVDRRYPRERSQAGSGGNLREHGGER